MGPSRKRARPNPPNAVDSASTNREAADAPLPTTPRSSPPAVDNSSDANEAKTKADAPSTLRGVAGSSSKQLKPKSSWYGGTWPRKSIASTQVARETILADKPKNGASSADLSRFEPKKASTPNSDRPPSMYLGKSKETLDITMTGTLGNDSSSSIKEPNTKSLLVTEEDTTAKATKGVEEAPKPPAGPKLEQTPIQRPATSSGWLGGWLGRPTLQTQGGIEATPEAPPASEQPPLPEQQNISCLEPQAPNFKPLDEAKPTATPSSWFGLWSTAAPSTAIDPTEAPIPTKIKDTDEDTVMEDAPVRKESLEPAAGSSWAFWSTDTSKKAPSSSGITLESGQLAISGESSQGKPEPAKTTETKNGKPNKKGRPQSVEMDESIRQLSQAEGAKDAPLQSTATAKTSPPNLLIPSIGQTYSLIENPSILQQIARLLLHGQQQPVKHVFLVKEPPKVKKALAIGIHGLFPAPLLRTVIGQPTGTSIRFANHAAAAIRRWTDKHSSVDCEIEKVALEGEGKIADRVDNLWKLLLNWIDHIRKADFILVACHSQGVPVAVMLVAKLIEFGVVSSGRIGICAMAGVSLGPFADYKSRLFSGSAGELFEFADPQSTVSKRYEDSLRVAVKYGVRVTYCGSIDDQLVSMESSIFSTVNHPYIYRAVFVDGRIHAPDFLSHLVGFALKLRNLGVSDHGLIRELSAPLAGSLYTGEGHSRLYDDGKVYDLAVEYALETTSVGDIPLDIQKYEIPNNANPYVLPWIMRGLLEEDFVKTELSAETTELLKQFDDWKPATKVLKDVKYRLEAVRSKL